MASKKIVFVAYQDQENLGVGYLTSMLGSVGFNAEIVDFGMDKSDVLELIRKADPVLVGFSLIFQYHTFKLRDLSDFLRANGIDCHFTVGGHYPSLRFDEILRLAPSLNSVVRFEGEETICELAQNLSTGKEWASIQGIAHRRNGKPTSNNLRPLIHNLDSLPFPTRYRKESYKCLGKNYATMIASRGCVRNCSFCSVRKFYQTPPGRVRRSRSPKNVVDEMKELYERNDVRIFLFQDDDFFQPGKAGREWVHSFLAELGHQDFVNDILWKVSCRTDEIDADLLKSMKEFGLEMIYLGIESGSPTGLRTLNKRLSVEDNISAVEILNELGILYEYGFMLFHPSTSFQDVRTNIKFLKRICGDGSAPVVFCKMLPYAETAIEKRLIYEGRLKGSTVQPDYSLLNPKLDDFCEFILGTYREWMSSPTGLLAILRWHRFELAVLKKFYFDAKGVPEYEESLKRIIASSNALFFHTVECAADAFESGSTDFDDSLQNLVKFQNAELKETTMNLSRKMDEFEKRQ